MQLGFVVALTDEAKSLGSGFLQGNVADRNQIEICGPGHANASLAAQRLLKNGARGLVSWGTCGGLDAMLKPGSVAIYEATINAAGERYECNREWRDRVMQTLTSVNPQLVSGFDSATTIATRREKTDLATRFGCRVVDMESGAIGQQAHRSGVPYVAIRVVVDPIDFEMPRAALQALKNGGQAQIWPVVKGIIRRPQELPALLRLAYWYRISLKKLRLSAKLLQPNFSAN